MSHAKTTARLQDDDLEQALTNAYSPDAFDSSRPRRLPEHGKSDWLYTGNPSLQKRLPWGIYFGDFRSAPNPSSLSWRITHETFHLLGPDFSAMPLIIIIATPITMLGMVANALLKFGGNNLSILYFLIPVGLIALYALKQVLKPSRVVTTLSRRKGTVWFAKENATPEETFPFDEFDAYFSTKPVRHGRLYILNLVHRYSGRRIAVSFSGVEWGIYRFWELLQQYMDISRPLPDVRALEPWRRFDPTTALYDAETGRPGIYWASSQLHLDKRRHKAWRECAMKFPWFDLPTDTDPYSGMQSADRWRQSAWDGETGTLCDSVLVSDDE